MDGKDWLLLVAALVIFGGPIGHVVWKRSRGDVHRAPAGENLITDTVRLGEAVTQVGGRALAEGAKLQKFGALRYNNDDAGKSLHLVGAS